MKAEHWKIDAFELCEVLKMLESPLDCKEIQPVHPKGNQSWIFIVRTDVETEAPILWPPDAEKTIHWRRPWCWERLKAGWHHWLNGHEFEQVLGAGDGYGSLVCSRPCAESDSTEQVTWTELNSLYFKICNLIISLLFLEFPLYYVDICLYPMVVPHCLNYCKFTVNFQMGKYESSK